MALQLLLISSSSTDYSVQTVKVTLMHVNLITYHFNGVYAGLFWN